MGSLSGLKIVEMSAIGPVPLAGMLLADMGADVVIIDKENDPWIMPHDVLRRGKTAVEVDLKSAAGVDQVKQLINQADIVIEGFRPKVMERLGLGPKEFSEVNSKLIFGRMTGWGQTGPLAETAGHDINYIAITGALQAMGRADSAPVPPLNLVGDYGGGTMFLVMGILAALHERQRSGQGQVVDAAITEGTANLMSMFYTMSHIGAWSTKRAANFLDSGAHFYDTYETSDQRYISLGPIEPHFYQIMLDKLGLDKQEFADQNNQDKWPELKQKITDVIKIKTQDQWCEIFAGSDACFAPVLDFTQAPNHAHLKNRQAYLNVDGQIQPAPAPRFSRTESKAGGPVVKDIVIEQVISKWRT